MVVGNLVTHHNGRKGALICPDNISTHVTIITQEGEVATGFDNGFAIAYNSK